MSRSDKQTETGGARSEQGQPHPAVAVPPAPPGELPQEAVDRTRAVSEALSRLGRAASPHDLADYVRSEKGVDLQEEEVRAIRDELLAREHPPGP